MIVEHDVPMIELSGLTKRYGTGQTVLDSVSLTISKGEFVSFIGPSGCGKSTALKLISGLAVPTAGTISIDGMTPKNAREIISFIFQDATLLPWRTVQQNVGLGLELEGVVEKRRKEKISQLYGNYTLPCTSRIRLPAIVVLDPASFMGLHGSDSFG